MNAIAFPPGLTLKDGTLPAAGKAVGLLQEALKRARLDIAPSDLARKELGASTVAAVKAFQAKAGLPADGTVTAATVGQLNAVIAHAFVANSKPRTQKLHDLLASVGEKIDASEIGRRSFGASTTAALKAFQAKAGLPQDGLVDAQVYDKLRAAALAAALASKTDVATLHTQILRCLYLAKLTTIRIDVAELRSRTLGPTSQAAIKALQTRFGVPATGTVNVTTRDRITAMAKSVPLPVATVKPRTAAELKPVRKIARLNKVGGHVEPAHAALAFLGYPLDAAEVKAQRFGKSTRAAVVKFEQDRHLPVSGHIAGPTLKALDAAVVAANPAAAVAPGYRFRGSVRDTRWEGIGAVTVSAWYKPVSGDPVKLGERTTAATGFYDLPYDPPVDPATKAIRTTFQIEVRAVDGGGTQLGSMVVFTPGSVAWANFTQGGRPYLGASEFDVRTAAIAKTAAPAAVGSLVEKPGQKQLSQAAQVAGLMPDEVMRVVLADLVAARVGIAALTPAVFYAYIGQNLPAALPGDLIGSTQDWTLIDNLVDLTANGIAFMDAAPQAAAFDNASATNLMPIAVQLDKAALMAAFDALRQSYALDKPILTGNGSLKALLEASAIGADHYGAVAATFLKFRSFGPEFWADAATHPDDFGGAAALADFKTTVEIGHVTKNFTPLLATLKAKVADPGDPIGAGRDLAKLSVTDWSGVITTAGGAVPPNTDGATPADQVATYAATLASQAEQMFPGVALVATVARSAANPLPNIAKVAAVLDANPDFDLRRDNVDTLFATAGADAATHGEARVLQRVHRITPTAALGEALLAKSVHSSSQIVGMGKDRVVALLTADPTVDAKAARTVFANAEYQYAQTLQRLTEFHADFHRADPAAIMNLVVAPSDLPPALQSVPDLATLFGSLDFCSCTHCQSVYGPAAYFTDLLRFIDQHPAEAPGRTVKDVLFNRRPDLGEIKLNCANTETPLPYIDLVNEILEAAVPAPAPAPDFNWQTTWPAAQLRAAPEYVRDAAYDVLRTADAPLNVAFDLWQTQARVFLTYLGVERWALMAAFQARPAGGAASPADADIAGEFFALSSHETAIVTGQIDAVDARQQVFWGLGATPLPATMSVADFLRRSFLDYDTLLALLAAPWIAPPAGDSTIVVDRPDATCDTGQQSVVNLSAAAYDRIQRFLRLQRHGPWQVWELDLLLRAPAIGDGTLDETALVHLYQFARVAARLKLSADRALMLFGAINAEARVDPGQPTLAIPSLYETLFLNPAVTTAIDPAFALPLAAGETVADHQPTILAAFGLSQADLALIVAATGASALSAEALAAIGRRAVLAQALGLTVGDLLRLIALQPATDPFARPQALLDFIDGVDRTQAAGLSMLELDYVLTADAASPVGLRDDVVAQTLGTLRDALRANGTGDPASIVAGQIATALGLPSDQAALLLAAVAVGGKSAAALALDPQLVAQDAAGNYLLAVTPATFPDLFAAIRALHKASLVVVRQRIATPDLAWLLAKAATFGLLDLAALPVAAPPVAPLFPAWLALSKWLAFDRLFPEPETMSLRAIFDAAGNPATPVATILAGIATFTQWDPDTVATLAAALALSHGATSDYAAIDTYLRLDTAAKMVRRIGMTAARLAVWTDRSGGDQQQIAQEIRQAAKGRDDDATWLTKVTPLEDSLRQAKRDALVGFLIAQSQATQSAAIVVGTRSYRNPAYWLEANDLLRYYAIDVQMNACQLTSRIKQAIGSVQMFVQRCLLGLEQPTVEVSRPELLDAVSDNSWGQWVWMKSNVLWEANRKVFLYPENWIDPSLRDDKSPFFVELENEILQLDITDDAATAAFQHYVHKVHDVARLDIVTAYYQLDDTDPRDNLPPDISLLHVVGRTRTDPAVYYYRNFDLNLAQWSAWEKIDVDIKGDQLCAVVYNRRLYLFWLTILEKPQKVHKLPPAQPTTGPTTTPEPPSQLEIQLSWTARTVDGWTPRKMSKQKLIHPWQRPLYAYNLKPRYKPRENMLWLDIYVSQTPEFNSKRFWDAYRAVNDFVTARHPFDPVARPWHSSSYLFDGEVVDLKMKPLTGLYHVLDANGIANDNLTSTTSLVYVQDSFGDEGRGTDPLSGPYEIAPRLPMPLGMHYKNTKIVNNRSNPTSLHVLENTADRVLLTNARQPFEIVASQHSLVFDTAAFGPVPFVYQDNQRSFFIRPEWQEVVLGYNRTLQTYEYKFFPNYHPYTALFLRELNRGGIAGLLNNQIQESPQTYFPGNGFAFAGYGPAANSLADDSVKTDIVDFARSGAYSLYNWEIFFHAPFMIACKLTQNQRFAEAMTWFHYIFDPTNVSSPDVPQRYWVTKPFHDQNGDAYRQQRIENLLSNIAQNQPELTAWKNHPFQPYLIARFRPVAFQKAVVMRYLDNLIAWGDQLFGQDTIEAINEATTLYVLAYELLGRRPVEVPNVEHADASYNDLAAGAGIDPFGNSQVEVLMENLAGSPVRVTRTQSGGEPLPTLDIGYFCIPDNDRLLGYWDTIADRLFKIRNCMNLQGVVRQLPLFDPPIDPALLVKAAAAGVDLGTVVGAAATAAGPYRFRQVAEMAAAIGDQVAVMGEKLLGALERRDAEALALLRGSQEISLQTAIHDLKQQAIDEANANWAALNQAQVVAQQRADYYGSRDFLNVWEGTALTLNGVSALAETAIALGYVFAGGLALIPKATFGASGFGGSPHVTADPVDGLHLDKAAEGGVRVAESVARAAEKLAAVATQVGSYQRRKDDWNFQADQAKAEVIQLGQQITAAEVRLALAQKDVENADLQIAQAQAVDAYMRSKYTAQQLYDWQVGQISTVYFQAYQIAFDTARRAEKCFQHELCAPTASFIQFGYWDSLKKGLLAGDRLGTDIRRMQAAYLAQNVRTLELTKHVSLAQVFPVALLQLKEAGTATVRLPEWLFDMDYPGHFRRRIRSIAVSIPAVVGPYTNVNCTLTLTNHAIRTSTLVAGGYGDPLGAPDPRFLKTAVAQTAIATSSGVNDSGLFELRFDDERYLPFEGAGAVSDWSLSLPHDCNQFDPAAVADVILHVRYQAEASGDVALTQAARDNLAAMLPPHGVRMIVVNQEFAGEWYRFLNPEPNQDQVLAFTLTRDQLPFYARARAAIGLVAVELIVDGADGATYSAELTPPGSPTTTETLAADPAFGAAQSLSRAGFPPTAAVLGDWTIKIQRSGAADFRSLPPAEIARAYLVVSFTAT